MKYWKAGLMFLIAYILQCSLLNVVAIGGYTPNLMLVCAIVITFLYGDKPYGLVFGAVFGLIYDVCYSMVTGPTAISLVAVCLLVMALRYSANVENIINLLISGISSIVLYYVLDWLLILLIGLRPGIMHSLYTMIFAGAYTLLILIIVYLVMRKQIIKHRRDRYFA